MAQRNMQLRISLVDVSPPIWRRVIVPSDFTLEQLHEVIQIAMGWTNSHLHLFEIGDTTYEIPDPDIEHEYVDERKARLEMVAKVGDRFLYRYDFGDDWEHIVEVEKILAIGGNIPKCTEGEHGCPPEDVGGAWSYPGFLKAWTNPKHPEHKQMRTWAGPYFDPELCDIRLINELLSKQFRRIRKSGSKATRARAQRRRPV